MITNTINSIARTAWKYGVIPKLIARVRTRLRIRRYLREHPTCLLNLGCGPYLREGWINGDINPRCEYYIDARLPLPLPPNSVDYIFSEHFVEHLPLTVLDAFLSEAHRVLRSGGVMRIGTPDLALLVRTYLQAGDDLPGVDDVLERHRKRFYRGDPSIRLTKAHWLNDKLRLWGEHHFIYDFETLEAMLRGVGFGEIVACRYGESNHPQLQGLEAHAENCEWMKAGEVVIIEARKP